MGLEIPFNSHHWMQYSFENVQVENHVHEEKSTDTKKNRNFYNQ